MEDIWFHTARAMGVSEISICDGCDYGKPPNTAAVEMLAAEAQSAEASVISNRLHA